MKIPQGPRSPSPRDDVADNLRNCCFSVLSPASGRDDRAAIVGRRCGLDCSWRNTRIACPRSETLSLCQSTAFRNPSGCEGSKRSFAWIDHRLLRNGYLPVMTHQDQALYLFLALAADRHGVSFYRKEKICDLLGLDWGAVRDGPAIG